MAEQETVQTFKCPRCGGPQTYQAALGGLVCGHCDYQEPIDASVVGPTAGEVEFTDETLAQAGRGWQVEHQSMSRPGSKRPRRNCTRRSVPPANGRVDDLGHKVYIPLVVCSY